MNARNIALRRALGRALAIMGARFEQPTFGHHSSRNSCERPDPSFR
jgi:hypothetical protein